MRKFTKLLLIVLALAFTGSTIAQRTCGSATPADAAFGVIGTTVYGYSVTADCDNGGAGNYVASFTGEAGATYVWDLCDDGSSSFDADIKIIDVDGASILSGVDGNSACNWNPDDFSWVCPANGTYYVVVSPYSSSGSWACGGTAASTFTLAYYKIAYVPPSTVTAPWAEPFTLTTVPTSWAMSGSENWLFSTGAAYGAALAGDHTTGGGTQYAWVDGSGTGTNTGITLTTPEIDPTGLSIPELTFWYFSNNTDTPGDNNTLYCEMSVDGGVWSVISTISGDNAAWQKVAYDLSGAGITSTVQFRFVVDEVAAVAYLNDMLIDDVAVDEKPITPIYSITPDPGDFGYVQVGNTASQTFTITNIGGGIGNIGGASISGDAVFTVASTTGIPGTLPSDVITVTVDFDPVAVAAYSATLSFTFETVPVATVALSGEGVAVIVNDDCADAIVVGPTYPETVLGTTKGAEVDCAGVLEWGAVWYEVTLPYGFNDLSASFCGTATPPMYTGGIVYIPDCASCASYVLADYYAFDACTAPDDATLQLSWDDVPGPGTIMFPAYAADEFDNGVDFTLTFDVTEGFIVPGTDCANPIVVGAIPYLTTDNTINYGNSYTSADEICSSSSYLNGDDAVYAYTPAVNETVDITLANTGTWVGLFVYEGCAPFTACMGSDTQSGGNPSITGLDLIGGTTYYIIISTWPTPDNTAYDLTIDVAAGPIPGDACDNAIVATVGVNNAPQQPVWYEYTTTNAGYLEISSLGNGVDTWLGVYSDCVPTLVASNDDYWGYPPGESAVGFAVGAGETYYFLWGDNYDTSPFTFTVLETNDASSWTGWIDNDWWNPANWTNDVGGFMTDATIPAGLTNYPTITGWYAAIGNLTVESDASLLDGGFLTVDGTLNVDRFIGGLAYHGFSPSVGGELIDIFHLASGQPDVYLYENNEPTFDYTELWTLGTPLNPFQGYMVWVDGADWTFTETGSLNTGAFGAVDNIYSTNGDLVTGWNLLGNPYTSALDWQSAYTASGVNVDATVYVNNPALGQWATWNNGTGGLNGGSQYIAMGQGFFVHATVAGVGTLTVDNTDRVHNNAPFLKSEISNKATIQVAGNGYTDETAIIFNDDASVGFDATLDAYKLMSDHPGVPSLYSLANNNLAVNVLPQTNWVQLGFEAAADGEYTISAIEINDIMDVVLEDTFTGEMTDLTTGSYAFTYAQGDDANRFIVHFTPLGLGDNMSEATNIYSHNNTIYINLPEITEGYAVVYDMTGKEVANKTINSTFNTITIEKSAYYLVKVLSNENIITEKVFIK